MNESSDISWVVMDLFRFVHADFNCAWITTGEEVREWYF